MTYGLTDTSLEEIFLSVAEQSPESVEDETVKCTVFYISPFFDEQSQVRVGTDLSHCFRTILRPWALKTLMTKPENPLCMRHFISAHTI